MRLKEIKKIPRYFPFSLKIAGKEKIEEKVEFFFPKRLGENLEKNTDIFPREEKVYYYIIYNFGV